MAKLADDALVREATEHAMLTAAQIGEQPHVDQVHAQLGATADGTWPHNGAREGRGV